MKAYASRPGSGPDEALAEDAVQEELIGALKFESGGNVLTCNREWKQADINGFPGTRTGAYSAAERPAPAIRILYCNQIHGSIVSSKCNP